MLDILGLGSGQGGKIFYQIQLTRPLICLKNTMINQTTCFSGKDPEKDEVTRRCSLTDKPKWFLYEIVSNKRSGIDCDKFDYFARDCANVGVKSNFDCRRYFQNVRILPVDGQQQLCVRDKEVFNLYELFHTRWSLHHRVCQHKTQAPIEDLLVQAFLKVDEVYHISESITDMKRYTDLTEASCMIF